MLHPQRVPNTIPWWTNQSILVLQDEAATIQFGESLIEPLENTTIVLLEGPLGSGKTSLVKGIAKGLEIKEPITSPTFALSHHYLKGKRALLHLDLYRIEEPIAANELFLEEEEIAKNYGGLIIIEWPSRLNLEMADACRMKLDYFAEGGRSIQIIPFSTDDKKSSTSK